MSKRICLDFDGVVHSYRSGWQGISVIPDPPVPGAFEAINAYLKAGFVVAIYSSRSCSEEGISAIKDWFSKEGFEDLDRLEFPVKKPPSVLYVDDRGYCFEGEFPSVDFVQCFKPFIS